jgi:hypothetical protein
MSVPKKSFTGKQPPPTGHPPRAPASPATQHASPLTGTTRNAGPGQTWFNLTRQDVERMSWEQLQKKKMSENSQQPAATDQGSLWQRLASLFRRSKRSD